MKWRTIPEAVREIKKHDPKTALTEYGLRKMAKEGTISTMPNGRMILVNLEELGGEK